jgi:hypothetical protein
MHQIIAAVKRLFVAKIFLVGQKMTLDLEASN